MGEPGDPTAPGWYEHVSNPGVLRYFDGQGWSAQTRTRVPAAAPPSAPVPVPASPPAAVPAPAAAPARSASWQPQPLPPVLADAPAPGTLSAAPRANDPSGAPPGSWAPPAPGADGGRWDAPGGAAFPGGSPYEAPSRFGTPPGPAPFGAPAAPSRFGTVSGPPAFGGPAASPGYGSTSGPAAYGSPTAASGYGTLPGTAPFGAVPGPAFGGSASTTGDWSTAPWLQPAQPSYAHWGWRVLARLIDELVVDIPIWGISFGIGLVWAISHQTAQLTDQQAQRLVAPAYLVGGIIWFVNRCVIAGRTGKSLGRLATGLRLVQADTGRPLGVWMAFVREFGQILNNLTLGLGYLWPLWDAKRQTFADKAVSSVVLR